MVEQQTGTNSPDGIEKTLLQLGLVMMWDKEESGNLPVPDLSLGIRFVAANIFLEAMRQYELEPPILVPSLEIMPRKSQKQKLEGKLGLYFTPIPNDPEGGFAWDSLETFGGEKRVVHQEDGYRYTLADELVNRIYKRYCDVLIKKYCSDDQGDTARKILAYNLEENWSKISVKMPDWGEIFSIHEGGYLPSNLLTGNLSDAFRKFREEHESLLTPYSEANFQFLSRFGGNSHYAEYYLEQIRQKPIRLLGYNEYNGGLCLIHWPVKRTCALQDPNSGAPIEKLFLVPEGMGEISITIDPFSGVPVTMRIPSYDGEHPIVPLAYPNSGAPFAG